MYLPEGAISCVCTGMPIWFWEFVLDHGFGDSSSSCEPVGYTSSSSIFRMGRSKQTNSTIVPGLLTGPLRSAVAFSCRWRSGAHTSVLPFRPPRRESTKSKKKQTSFFVSTSRGLQGFLFVTSHIERGRHRLLFACWCA